MSKNKIRLLSQYHAVSGLERNTSLICGPDKRTNRWSRNFTYLLKKTAESQKKDEMVTKSCNFDVQIALYKSVCFRCLTATKTRQRKVEDRIELGEN